MTRNLGGGIIGRGIIQKESLRREASGKHLGGIWEVFGRHLGGICDSRRPWGSRLLEAIVAIPPGKNAKVLWICPFDEIFLKVAVTKSCK